MGRCSTTTTPGACRAHRPDRPGTAIIATGMTMIAAGMTTIASAMTTIAGVAAGSHAPYGPAFRHSATGCPSGMAGPRRSGGEPDKAGVVVMDKDRIAG